MLAEKLRQLQEAGLVPASTLLAKMPLPIHDAQLLSEWLAPAAVHEWYLDWQSNIAGWFPPLTAVTAMTLQIMQKEAAAARRQVWVGRSCWPTFQMLTAEPCGESFLEHCIFLDPLTQADKIWSIAEALRNPGVGVVIADGCGLDATATRRLQLAAESGTARAFISRPLQDRDTSSWAQTQWVVRPKASEGFRMQWDIQLLRSRGRQIRQDASCHWSLDWTYEVLRGKTISHLSAGMGHPAYSASRQIRAG